MCCVRWILSWLWIAGVFGACAASPASSTQRTIAALDPVFGGGAILEQRLLGSPHYELAGDPEQRAAFLAACRANADREAEQLVAQVVTPAFAIATQEFTASAACAALWSAETLALSCYGMPADSFVVDAANEYSDPALVGPAATSRGKALEETMRNGASPSPARLAIAMGASRMRPEHAEQLAAFLKGPQGREWQRVRTQAFLRSQAHFVEVRAIAEQQGFLRSRIELEELALPRAIFAEEESSSPAIELLVRRDGTVEYQGRQLAAPGRPEDLRAALRELRRAGLAAGTLTLGREASEGGTVEVVQQIVRIDAAPGTEWSHLGALLAECSQPEIAFWRVELRAKPK